MQQTSKVPACDEYVFGYSTGHVGTTTLSAKKTFADGNATRLRDVAFFFEVDRDYNATEAATHGLSMQEQEAHELGQEDMFHMQRCNAGGHDRERAC